MRDRAAIVFVEVRFRRNLRYGSGAETVGARKQARLVAAALLWQVQNRVAARFSSRFDVVSITRTGGNQTAIEWIQNALEV